MSRAQSGRKRLAVPARQLAVEPCLQILRRSRRPLLCGVEQARQSALAHHVHRIAPLGAPVLINGTRYKPSSTRTGTGALIAQTMLTVVTQIADYHAGA